MQNKDIDNVEALVERQLYAYRINAAKAKTCGQEKALDWLSGGFGRVHSATNRNGMEKAVIEAMSEAEEDARWCQVFEQTFAHFRHTKKANLMRMLYLHRETPMQICMTIPISAGTFQNWRREILEIACKRAAELNLIDREK